MDRKLQGFFKYNGNINTLQVGDLIEVRMEQISEKGFYKAHYLKVTRDKEALELIRPFSGVLKLKVQGFGHIGEVFIDPRIVGQFKLQDNQTIKGKAMLSFDKKKNQWGWKAFSIQK